MVLISTHINGLIVLHTEALIIIVNQVQFIESSSHLQTYYIVYMSCLVFFSSCLLSVLGRFTFNKCMQVNVKKSQWNVESG